MNKFFNMGCHERANPVIICLLAVCLITLSCHKIQSHETIENKMPAILVNMISADDPGDYAERHGIRLKDGMIRIIMTIDNDLPLQDISARYGLKDFQRREDLVTTYISIDGLKGICKEPGVVYIRLPVRFIND